MHVVFVMLSRARTAPSTQVPNHSIARIHLAAGLEPFGKSRRIGDATHGHCRRTRRGMTGEHSRAMRGRDNIGVAVRPEGVKDRRPTRSGDQTEIASAPGGARTPEFASGSASTPNVPSLYRVLVFEGSTKPSPFELVTLSSPNMLKQLRNIMPLRRVGHASHRFSSGETFHSHNVHLTPWSPGIPPVILLHKSSGLAAYK